ncbi:MAG TPA: TadE family protein [Candidatus Limnocylindria bacterium]|nr:TadE family protein [Candidatus Limnocylindria bacterium]
MKLLRSEGGQSLVEFALVLPLVLLLITGLFDLARAAWQENSLAFAAREGSRYAMVHGANSSLPLGPNSPSDPNIAAVVRQNAVGVANISVTTSWPDGDNERGMRVAVEASAPFVPLPSIYLLGGTFQITLRGGSQLVIEN